MSGFFIKNSPPQAGLASDFQAVYFASHPAPFVDGVMAVCGVLFFSGRYVALVLVTSAAPIDNIPVFHTLFLAPATLIAPIVSIALRLPIALPMRAQPALLLAAKHVNEGQVHSCIGSFDYERKLAIDE